MAKLTFLICLALLVFAAASDDFKRRESANLQKVLKEHSDVVGLGLSGRLARGPDGLVGSKYFPPVHEHLNGNRPCRHGGIC